MIQKIPGKKTRAHLRLATFSIQHGEFICKNEGSIIVTIIDCAEALFLRGVFLIEKWFERDVFAFSMSPIKIRVNTRQHHTEGARALVRLSVAITSI